MSNEDIWHQIDSSVASLVGQRVFYNHKGTKCLAFVTRAGFDRDTSGHIQNTLVVFTPTEILFPVLSYPSSGREEGSFDIAQPGDLTDSGKTEQPIKEVTEEVESSGGFNTSPLPPIAEVTKPIVPLEGEETVAERKARKQQRRQHLT